MKLEENSKYLKDRIKTLLVKLDKVNKDLDSRLLNHRDLSMSLMNLKINYKDLEDKIEI
jgi:hypothetical protein